MTHPTSLWIRACAKCHKCKYILFIFAHKYYENSRDNLSVWDSNPASDLRARSRRALGVSSRYFPGFLRQSRDVRSRLIGISEIVRSVNACAIVSCDALAPRARVDPEFRGSGSRLPDDPV